MDKAVRLFNAEQSEYEARTVDYGDASVRENMYKLSAELITGNGPDMLMIYGMNYQNLANKNALLDMSDWFDASEFFAGPYESMRYKDGVYWISPSYSIVNQYALSKNVQDLDGNGIYGFEEIKATWEKFNTTGKVFLRSYADYDRVIFTLRLANMLKSDFINENTSTCSFDSPQFIEMLDFGMSLLPSSTKETETGRLLIESEYPDAIDALCVVSGESMIGEFKLPTFLDSVIKEHNRIISYLVGGDITNIGIVGGRSAGCLYDLPISVCSASANVDGAKKFIDSLWDLDYLSLRESELRGFPLKRSVLDNHYEYMKQDNQSHMSVSDYLKIRESEPYRLPPLKFLTPETPEDALVFADIWVPYTDEMYAELTEFIDTASVQIESSEHYNPILQSEIEAMFAGIQDAETTAKNIQKRYTIYLNEQK